MHALERPSCLADADVTDVDAQADELESTQAGPELGEPIDRVTGGVLEENVGASGRLAQVLVELAEQPTKSSV